MEPIVVCPCVYVLELEDGCYYVGSTHDLNKRFAQHLAGKAAGWTKLHKPLRVAEVIFDGVCGYTKENDVTRSYIAKYGADVVKGGGYCKIAPGSTKKSVRVEDATDTV